MNMNQENWHRIMAMANQTVADMAVVDEALRSWRVTWCADKARAAQHEAATIATKMEAIEPDWHRPDTSDCHTYS